MVLYPVPVQHRGAHVAERPPGLVGTEATLPSLGAAQDGPGGSEPVYLPDSVGITVYRTSSGLLAGHLPLGRRVDVGAHEPLLRDGYIIKIVSAHANSA
jgi:hypothetical protein